MNLHTKPKTATCDRYRASPFWWRIVPPRPHGSHRVWGAKPLEKSQIGLYSNIPYMLLCHDQLFNKVGNLAASRNPELLVPTLTRSPPAPYRMCDCWRSICLQAPISHIVFKSVNTSGDSQKAVGVRAFRCTDPDGPDGPATELITLQCTKCGNIPNVLMCICSFMLWGSVVHPSLIIASPIHDLVAVNWPVQGYGYDRVVQ